MGNVYCSVALPSEIFSTQSPAMFSQTFILSFLERMEPAIHLNVKWPNDVFIDGKKVGGVLLEASFSGNVLKRAVLGVGINVVSAPGREAPLETAYEAAALQTYCPSLSLSSVLMEVIQAVEDGINLYKNGAQCEFIANNWKKFDMLHHRQVDVRFNGATFSGKILGVDSDGRLILRLNAGKRMFFESAEAKIIL
jgi:BirA family biotin operon repressor/biotin-[acetyl-CoA-carboxylase] ligase